MLPGMKRNRDILPSLSYPWRQGAYLDRPVTYDPIHAYGDSSQGGGGCGWTYKSKMIILPEMETLLLITGT